MPAEMSPVELLPAAAEAARGGERPQGGHWLLVGLGDRLAGMLDDIADRHHPIGDIVTFADGRVERRQACRYCSGQFDCTLAEWPCADVRGALAVARVLLGVPDGA